MLKGQKSVREGIEDFLCPFTDVYITQGSGGEYSHKGTKAIDVRGKKSGYKYPYYAPCTVKCIKTYPSSGQVMWQSVENVRCPNGYAGKVTFMTVHDDTMDAKTGLVVPQGNQLGNMGTKGNATGVHCHIEIAQTSNTTWKKNSYGIYMFNNEVEFEDACFMDGTNIISGTANWKYLKDVPVEELKPATNEDKVNIEKHQKEIDILKETIKKQDAEILELKKQLKEQPKELFTCTKTGDYQIKLYESEKLFIK